MDDRVDRRETVDNSEVYVLSDRAETFRLGGRMKPPGSDDEYDVDGRLVKTFLLLDMNCDDFRSMVSALDTGRFGVMKP
jgi:hypothetical protein